MSKYETPLTRAYWRSLGEGILYEEFRVVKALAGLQSWRAVDGVVVLGTTARMAAPGERAGLSLDDRDVIVIQTKATRLNPYVVGQALLSMDLIRMRWAPRSLRSVLICAADDPELRPVTDMFPGIEIHVARSDHLADFSPHRLRGAAAELARQRGASLLANPRLTSSFQIDGIISPPAGPHPQPPLPDLVAGQEVTTVHSRVSKGKPAILGMSLSGEVIASQKLLLRMGASAAHSIVAVRARRPSGWHGATPPRQFRGDSSGLLRPWRRRHWLTCRDAPCQRPSRL